MKYFFLLLGVLLAAGTTVCGQSAIDARKQELKELRNSIKKTQQRLHTLRAEEKKASRSLTGLQRQRHSITLFIRELQDTLTRLTDSATALEGRIRQTRQALTDVEQSYNAALRSLAVWKSKNRGTPLDDGTTASLFRSLTRSVVQYRGRMVELRDSLNKQQGLLSDYTRTQTVVLQAKAGQEKVLNRTIQKSSKELRSLQSSKRATQRELNTKTASLRKLSSIINKLVAEARRKADAERRASEKKITGRQPILRKVCQSPLNRVCSSRLFGQLVAMANKRTQVDSRIRSIQKFRDRHHTRQSGDRYRSTPGKPRFMCSVRQSQLRYVAARLWFTCYCRS